MGFFSPLAKCKRTASYPGQAWVTRGGCQGDWICLTLSKEPGRVRRALPKVETEHIMFQQLWETRQSGLPADSSTEDPTLLLQRAAKSPRCWRRSSSFPSALFPADLCRQWEGRWEWGKEFPAHLVPPLTRQMYSTHYFLRGVIQICEEAMFQITWCKLLKSSSCAPRKHICCEPEKWISEKSGSGILGLCKCQPFNPNLSNVVLLYCMEASLKHKLVCLFINYICFMESMICRKHSSFWTQGQNPSFQSVQTIFMLKFCSS